MFVIWYIGFVSRDCILSLLHSIAFEAGSDLKKVIYIGVYERNNLGYVTKILLFVYSFIMIFVNLYRYRTTGSCGKLNFEDPVDLSILF
jgi:hypothetical protein